MDFWEGSLQSTSGTHRDEFQGTGCKYVMKTFQFLFSCFLGNMTIKQTYNLSKNSLNATTSAAQGQDLLKNLVTFTEEILNRKTSFFYAVHTVVEMLLKDRCDDPEKFYRQLYFKTFDNIMNCIKSSFNQKGYQIYVHFQEFQIKAFKDHNWGVDFQVVIQNYGVNKIDVTSLKTHLLHLPKIGKFYGFDHRMQLLYIIALFQKLGSGKKMLIAEFRRW